MDWSALFFINSIALGAGLAMDAFTVSLVNGMNFPHVGFSHASRTAGTFAVFQAIMPMTGWLLAHTLLEHFGILAGIVPWISALLLIAIGVKMIKEREKDLKRDRITDSELIAQGVATSIDALSAGLTLSGYGPAMAVTASLIIAAVTYVICLSGVHLGKKCGLRLARRAAVLGGIILILLGGETMIRTIF